MRPLAITCRRSAISNSSSSSSLTTSTAQPASRRASISARICAAAPTSTPQVGCEMISSLGAASISRPTMNFCKLPPDKLRAGALGPPAFTLNRAMICAACVRRAFTSIQPLLPTAWSRVSSKLCARLMLGTAPRPRRSSGTKCRPMARRCWGAAWLTSCAPMRKLLCGARMSSPLRAYSSSFCPLPDTPAMPSTSPLRTVRLMPSKSTPNSSARGRLRLFTLSTASPAWAARCTSAGGSLPIISLDNDALLSLRGSHTPVTLPPRSTVQAVHSARISCSLWLMYKMLQPCAASSRSVANSLSTACGVSTEVGSSNINRRGSVSNARTISTRCRSPTLSVCTGRRGSMSRPYCEALAVIFCCTCASDSDLSKPSHTFSATLMVSNKLKC